MQQYKAVRANNEASRYKRKTDTPTGIPLSMRVNRTPLRDLKDWSGLCGGVEKESSLFALRYWTQNETEGE